MAVVEMKRISIYALKSSRKSLLELLQRRGVVEIDTPKKADEFFTKTDTATARQTFEKNSQLLTGAAAILDKYAPPEKGLPAMLKGRTPIGLSRYEETARQAPEMAKTASRIAALEKKIADGQAEIIRRETQMDALKPWMGLDVSMRTIGTDSTSVFIGSFPEEMTEADLKAKLAAALPDVSAVEAEIVSAQAQQTCAFVLCHSKYGMKVEAALRSMGFSYPAATPRLPPAERAEVLNEKIAEQKAEITAAKQEIVSYKDKREDLLFTADYYAMRADKYRVLGDLWQSPHVFQVTGYIPAENAPTLEQELEANFHAYVEVETPGPGEELPVKLKNGFLASPVEGVVEGYSLPGRHEVDPSRVMCLFYYVLFGMMLSDAAYGLLIVLGCGILLLKFTNIEESLRKSLKMFFFCGISTTFWGVMFGSYFGDAIPVIAETFFGKEITIAPLWFAPLDQPMRLLLFSFLLGIIHLFTGLGVQFYQLAKRNKLADALYDVVFWYFLVGGLILVLLSTDMFHDMMSLSFQLPPIVGTIAGIFAGIGAVGIVLTSGRESKNPGKRLLKGLYGLYGVSSYLSDILSYSRLLALGLATGVIAQVFNQMGAMIGGSIGGPIGAIAFALVFLVGHVMNLAINMLGAYVHTNRLQYVEFFGKFYEGGGCKFAPFTAKTKYFKIMEEK